MARSEKEKEWTVRYTSGCAQSPKTGKEKRWWDRSRNQERKRRRVEEEVEEEEVKREEKEKRIWKGGSRGKLGTNTPQKKEEKER